ncbi:Asp-tRNA(Asn)/Glu-tRNA(Gln) amidotransferase subunit GatB [bacterium]|nr:Asp-tRNA(Asn)/Glu-tRNA(Gln) amidotransferase subunit GatB [candidate division CSSED10-310 bacterium]
MNTAYEAVIGLEFHVQLITATKIFCSCAVTFGDPPNTNTCPVCLGLPGCLPVLNRRVVEQALRIGLVLNCDIQPWSAFARKNYFYPDLPKGYQISQFEHPFGLGGFLDFELEGETRRVQLTRIHLEEDAGKLIHPDTPWAKGTYVDFNRCGAPLMEIVTEPDLRSPAAARAFMHTLRDLLRHIGVCEGNLEEGNMRCDANLSVRPQGSDALRPASELKNLNSFRFLQQALEYEFKRQVEIYQAGGHVVRETRQFDPATGVTIGMRSKEAAHDYRYFPEPDLVPLVIDDSWTEMVRDSLPELPARMKQRFAAQYGISEYDAAVLTSSLDLAAFFETAAALAAPKQVANWLMGDVTRLLKQESIDIEASRLAPEHLAQLVRLIDEGVISGSMAKDILEESFSTGTAPGEVVERRGLSQISDDTVLEEMVKNVLAAHPDKVSAYRSGRVGLYGFFMGQVMKQTKGKANPQLLDRIMRAHLGTPAV